MINSVNIPQAIAMFVIPLLVVLVPIILGERYGIHRSKAVPSRKDFPLDSAIAAALGLLGFILAFTFQIAADRFGDRKEALLSEVANIRTAYLRSGLIPEPYHSESKKLLVEYIDIRVSAATDFTKLDRAMARSQQILDTLWIYTEKLAAQDRSSEAYSLYTTSINDMVDIYNQRLAMALMYRLPLTVMLVLGVITFLSMFAFGYQFGIIGKGSIKLNTLIATIFAIVMFLILALDRPESGVAPINQKPLLNLQKQLQGMQLTVETLR